MNITANETSLKLQNALQIRSVIIEYNFFLASMYFRHLSVVSLALYSQASRAISIG